jgi:hypothetical protein
MLRPKSQLVKIAIAAAKGNQRKRVVGILSASFLKKIFHLVSIGHILL